MAIVFSPHKSPPKLVSPQTWSHTFHHKRGRQLAIPRQFGLLAAQWALHGFVAGVAFEEDGHNARIIHHGFDACPTTNVTTGQLFGVLEQVQANAAVKLIARIKFCSGS